LAQGRDIFKYYKGTQIAVCLYPLLLPFLFVAFRDAAFIQRHPFIFAGVFSVLPVLSGFIGGFQYPLAAQSISYYRKDISPSHSEGLLYAVDALGASLGAIFVAIVLIPTLGITSVAMMCSCLSFFVLIWLVVSR
jgi:predicted membrane-bound spermidine synthase